MENSENKKNKSEASSKKTFKEKQIGHIARLLWLIGKFIKETSKSHPISISRLEDAYCNEFNDSISTRTLQRDIAILREASFSVEQVKNGSEIGYYLKDIIDKSISQEEINVLLAAQQYCPKQVDGNLSVSLYEKMGEMIQKFSKFLNEKSQEQSEELKGRLYSFATGGLPSWKMISEVIHAIGERKVLKITYHAMYNNVVTDRMVEPIGMYMTRGNWVIVAFCRFRDDYREFRLDRIQHLFVTSEKIKQERYQELEQYFMEHWDYWED